MEVFAIIIRTVFPYITGAVLFKSTYSLGQGGSLFSTITERLNIQNERGLRGLESL